VPTIRLFASAREAAGTGRDVLAGSTVAEVLGEARRRYGTPFADVLPACRIWVNGEPAQDADAVAEGDEVAVLPPVSGGAVPVGRR
jgi:sulfur-carrier protein